MTLDKFIPDFVDLIQMYFEKRYHIHIFGVESQPGKTVAYRLLILYSLSYGFVILGNFISKLSDQHE